jgi:hypothetical protein
MTREQMAQALRRAEAQALFDHDRPLLEIGLV